MPTTSSALPFHESCLVDERLCPLCLVTKPIAEYRPHAVCAGKRYRAPHCNSCHARRELERRTGKKREADQKLMHAAWGSLARPETKRMAVEKFLISLMQHFGGPQAFAKAWHECFVEATAMKRVRAAVAMLRLLDRYEHKDADPKSMTDEELAMESRQVRATAFAELLLVDPATAVQIAERCGYRLSVSAEVESGAVRLHDGSR